MKTFKKIPFSHNGEKYEIRIMYDESNVKIVAFLHNHPANGFRYILNFPKKYDIKKALKNDNLNTLIDFSRADIREDRWKTGAA